MPPAFPLGIAALKFNRHSFSRSYGVILPSSLTTVIPSILQFSCRPPVAVCGTGTHIFHASSFSCQCRFVVFAKIRFTRAPTLYDRCLNSCLSALALRPHIPSVRTKLSSCVPASCLCQYIGGDGILTICPSATPFGLVLGPD